MRVLFMGTPEFARVALENLIKNKTEIIGAVTQPDKPAGRKLILTPPPVKELALKHDIKVYQPSTLRNEEFAELLREIAPDIIIVAAYGKILPKNVLEFPECGCINIHASLLPKYRGAAPINAAIMAGEKVTGITIIYMDEGIDTGDMILKGGIEIGAGETYGDIHDKLAVLGGELIVEALKQIKSGTAKREKQPEDGASYMGLINNEMCEIDWSLPAHDINNKIRGLSPSPTAYTWLNGKKLKIYKSRVSDNNYDGTNGEVVNINKIIEIKACDKIIGLLELQIEGSKKMSAADFINGRRIEKGAVLGR